MRPSSLFEGVAQRLSIFLMTRNSNSRAISYTGGYRRWNAAERDALLDLTAYWKSHWTDTPTMPISKFSAELEGSLLRKIDGPSIRSMVDSRAEPILVHRIVRYFVKALDFVPTFVDAHGHAGKSEDYKDFHFTEAERPILAALINSSLFYWFWRTHADGFHCGYRDVYLMPYAEVTNSDLRDKLQTINGQIQQDFKSKSKVKTINTKAGSISYQEFYPKASKALLDRCDRLFGIHYGWSDEELDFILNYDIKYRTGGEADDQ